MRQSGPICAENGPKHAPTRLENDGNGPGKEETSSSGPENGRKRPEKEGTSNTGPENGRKRPENDGNWPGKEGTSRTGPKTGRNRPGREKRRQMKRGKSGRDLEGLRRGEKRRCEAGE
jgi:hypothetical protein